MLHCSLYPSLSLFTLTLKEWIRSSNMKYQQHSAHTSQTHTPTTNQDIENLSGGIEHSVTPRTLMKVHVGESTMHISYLLTHPHRRGCTQTHIDRLQAEVTQVHTPAGTHTGLYLQRQTSWTWLRFACKVVWQFLEAERSLSGCCFSFTGFVAEGDQKWTARQECVCVRAECRRAEHCLSRESVL